MQNWYKDWFESPNYLHVYNHRDDTDAQKLSDLILSTTNLSPSSKILDAACGSGRHAIYFSLKGYKVFGFDLSKNLLQKAYENSVAQYVHLHLIQADIREICFKSEFDLILNLFTSFGYFESDEENFSFIKRAFSFLKENGYYVMDYFNKYYLEKNLVPESEKNIDELKIIEKRKIENDRVIKEITILKNNFEEKYFESVKLYDANKIIEEFLRSGYKLDKIFGDYDGNEFQETISPRVILFFKK